MVNKRRYRGYHRFLVQFPEGIMIGTIADYSIGSGSNFYKIKVTLAADFRSLVEVALVRINTDRKSNNLNHFE